MFAVEGSKTLKENGFDDVKRMVIKMLDSYKISKVDTHVGFLEFSDTTTVEISLDTTYDSNVLKELVKNVVPSGGETTNLAKTLRKVAEVFKVKNGGRPGVPKVLVIINAKRSSGDEPLTEAVEPLKEEGVQLFVITIGNETDPDLSKITPKGNDKTVKTPKDLADKVDGLVDKIGTEVDNGRCTDHFSTLGDIWLACTFIVEPAPVPLKMMRAQHWESHLQRMCQ